MTAIQFQIQLENVDTWFTQNSKLPISRELLNQGPYLRLTDVSFLRDSCDLKLGCCRRNLRVEARAGRCYKVHRHWS